MKDTSFLVRTRSSVVLMAITIGCLLFGGNLLFGVLLVISLIGQMELYRVIKVHDSLMGGIGYLACIGYYLLLVFEYEQAIIPLFIGSLMAIMAVYVLTFSKYNSEQTTMTFFGLIYVAVMLSFIYRVRMLPDGAYTVWLIFIGSWGSDTCAYLVGRKIGKHKMAPVLSPKKSVEGLFGGIIGAAILGLLYGLVFQSHIHGVTNPALAFAIMGACSAVISQIGDLAASAIKRNHQIKDYGKLIPGHGGILDRFDSVIFTAPIVYYLAVILA